MSEKPQRDFDSFRWIKIPPSTMFGFGVSSDFFSFTPWTMDGEPRPYFGRVLESETERETGTFYWWTYFIGPFLVQHAYIK